MNMMISYENGSGYLIAHVSGEWTLDEAKRHVEGAYAEAVRRGFTRLFLDVLEMSAPKSEMIRFFTGEHMALIWDGSLKVAALAKPDATTRFAENVAVNRGGNFKVFFDESAAITWLKKGS